VVANTVKVHIPGELRAQVGSQNEIVLQGASVKEVLGTLADRYPVLGKRLFAADGRLNRFVNIYLNDEDIRFLENLDTVLKDGDSVQIVPAIAGG
jgi:sulfur-carrier protein